MSLLQFQENINALWSYWSIDKRECIKWRNNHQGWMNCHSDEEISTRKGYIRALRREKKRRVLLIKRYSERILYCEAMLREITQEVGDDNKEILRCPAGGSRWE